MNERAVVALCRAVHGGSTRLCGVCLPGGIHWCDVTVLGRWGDVREGRSGIGRQQLSEPTFGQGGDFSNHLFILDVSLEHLLCREKKHGVNVRISCR